MTEPRVGLKEYAYADVLLRNVERRYYKTERATLYSSTQYLY